MRPLLLLLLLATNAAAGPYSALGKPCALREAPAGFEVLYFDELRLAFRDALVRGSRDPVPKTEAEAEKRLCGDEGCPGLQSTTFHPEHPRPAPAGKPWTAPIHGLVFGADHGAWVLPDLGWAARSPCDGTKIPAFTPVGDGLYLVELSESDGDTSGGRRSACLPKRYARSTLLVDLVARKVLWVAEAMGKDDRVAVSGRKVAVSVCGQPARSLTLPR